MIILSWSQFHVLFDEKLSVAGGETLEKKNVLLFSKAQNNYIGLPVNTSDLIRVELIMWTGFPQAASTHY